MPWIQHTDNNQCEAVEQQEPSMRVGIQKDTDILGDSLADSYRSKQKIL